MGVAAWTWRRPGDPAEFGGLLQIERGSLYPALHRLEAQGLISSEWKSSDAEPAGKVLPADRGGKKQLAAEQSKWKLMVQGDRPRNASCERSYDKDVALLATEARDADLKDEIAYDLAAGGRRAHSLWRLARRS